MVGGFQQLFIFANGSILDNWLGSEYFSGQYTFAKMKDHEIKAVRLDN